MTRYRIKWFKRRKQYQFEISQFNTEFHCIINCWDYYSVFNVESWFSICISVLENKATYFDFNEFRFIFSFLLYMKPTITIPSNEIEHMDTIMYVIWWLSDSAAPSFRVSFAAMTVAFKYVVFVVDNVPLRINDPSLMVPVWTGGYYGDHVSVISYFAC